MLRFVLAMAVAITLSFSANAQIDFHTFFESVQVTIETESDDETVDPNEAKNGRLAAPETLYGFDQMFKIAQNYANYKMNYMMLPEEFKALLEKLGYSFQ